MTESLKNKALNAVIWNALQKYGTLAISFITNIILARLLTVDDFGVIGILSVFLAIAYTITESGFNSALIQSNKVTQTDYCTAFFWNIWLSILMVIILFFSSPLIAKYFNQPILTSILRLQSIILFINSFCLVQTAKLMKELKFKTLSIRNISASIGASITGIILAFLNFGVWSLVWQSISASIIGAILLWSASGWKPTWNFSWLSFKKMFKFGSYIFISSISNTLYINIQSFIIGKIFSIKDLGYYSQAKKLEQIPIDGTSSVINAVLFPVYSSIVNDRQKHKNVVRKNMSLLTFITFPLMSFLVVIGPYLIPIMYGTKWNNAIPMFQILCIGGMFTPLNQANVEIFRSLGRGGVYLTLQTLKRLIGIGIILVSIKFGLYTMLWAITGIGIITYLLNLIFTHNIFGYTYKEQLSDIVPNLIISVLICGLIICLFHTFNFNSNWINLFISSFSYILLYFTYCWLFKPKGYLLLCDLISSKLKSFLNNKLKINKLDP